jgi:hypothetical protein
LENILRELFLKEFYIIVVSVCTEEYVAFNRNYGTNVVVELPPHTAANPNSSTAGTKVRTADTQVFNSRQDGCCSACVAVSSKLDDVVSSLRTLSVKVDSLERKLSTLCEQNAGLRS